MATIFLRKKNVLSKKGIGQNDPYRDLKAEEKLCRRVFAEIVDVHPLIYDVTYAVKNEGKRGWAEGKLQKELGLRAGFPDINIDYPFGKFHGLRIELKEKSAKTGKYGKPSAIQLKKIERLNELGFFAKVCYGFDDVKQTIDQYLKDEI